MEYMDSKESEFIAIYGRRRVGKTFEFDNLYRALFKYSEKYIKVVEALAMKGKGLSRMELIKQSGLANNGGLTTMLKELETCGFIRRYEPFGKLKKDALYQRVDFLAGTKTRKSIQLTFVTTYGVKPNAYSSRVQSEVLLEDLFVEA